MTKKISDDTISLLACPKCSERPALERKDEKTLVCSTCNQAYEIAPNGISRLVKEELKE